LNLNGYCYRCSNPGITVINMHKCLVLTSVVWFAFHVSALRAYPPPDPPPSKLRQLIVAGDLKGAVKVCDSLAEYYRQLGTQPPPDSIAANYEFFMGYYLLAKAQVLALQHDFVAADLSFSEAERSVKPREDGQVGMFDPPWKAL